MATQPRLPAPDPDEPAYGRVHPVAAPASLPPLENGDRMTRSEFERRYEEMPRLKKAELIEGVVYLGGRVRYNTHGVPHSNATGWLGRYCALTPGTSAAVNSSVRLDLENEVQPDVMLRLERHGRSQISADDSVEGAPELVVEIAASSASYDLHDKLRAYRRKGVQEYIVWRTLDGAIDWRALEDTTYMLLVPDEAGIIRSRVFPGLWLNVPALLSGDLAAVLATAQQGLASLEHAVFVERLRGAEAPAPQQDS